MATSDKDRDDKYAKIGKELYQTVEEQLVPVQAKVEGTFPSWINGSVVRVGPAKFEWGKTSYNHWFDGDSILHKFEIKNAKVNYSSQFLQSKTYLEAKKYGRITLPGFATWTPPDPCKNIFERFFLYFLPCEMTDNCNVNVVQAKGASFVTTETSYMYQIDPFTLPADTLAKVDARTKLGGKLFGQRSWVPHPHTDEERNYYNFSAAMIKSKYQLIKIPPKVERNHSLWDDMQIIAEIQYKGPSGYFHSFGMSENYFILIANPLTIDSLWKVFLMNFKKWSFLEMLKWHPEKPTMMYVVSRTTGKLVKTFALQTFFVFHHINAYETDNDLLIDLCGFPDASIIKVFYLYKLRSGLKDCTFSSPAFRRYHVPLAQLYQYDSNISKNPAHLPAHLPALDTGEFGGADFEVICNEVDFPRINYEKYNAKPYQYAYFLGYRDNNFWLSRLVKVNVQTKECLYWEEEDCYPSEPLFVPSPDAKDEDDGVVLSTVVGVLGKTSFLLVLDAKTFDEIARAEVTCKLIPALHGAFLDN